MLGCCIGLKVEFGVPGCIMACEVVSSMSWSFDGTHDAGGGDAPACDCQGVLCICLLLL